MLENHNYGFKQPEPPIKDRLFLIATTYIYKGQELFLRYGPEYWSAKTAQYLIEPLTSAQINDIELFQDMQRQKFKTMYSTDDDAL